MATMVKILVIEDEAAFRDVVAAALRRNGFEVLEAPDGRVALSLCNESHVDVIVTDVLMPDIDGVEVIIALRKMKNTVPIIAMTGHPALTEVYLRVAKTLGADKVLEKPFTMEQLLKAVRDVMPSTEPHPNA